MGFVETECGLVPCAYVRRVSHEPGKFMQLARSHASEVPPGST